MGECCTIMEIAPTFRRCHLCANFHSASISGSGPTNLVDLADPDLQTGVLPTIVSLQAAEDPPPAPMPAPTDAQHHDMDPQRLAELDRAEIAPLNIATVFRTAVAPPHLVSMTTKEAAKRIGTDRMDKCRAIEATNLFITDDAIASKAKGLTNIIKKSNCTLIEIFESIVH